MTVRKPRALRAATASGEGRPAATRPGFATDTFGSPDVSISFDCAEARAARAIASRVRGVFMRDLRSGTRREALEAPPLLGRAVADGARLRSAHRQVGGEGIGEALVGPGDDLEAPDRPLVEHEEAEGHGLAPVRL